MIKKSDRVYLHTSAKTNTRHLLRILLYILVFVALFFLADTVYAKGDSGDERLNLNHTSRGSVWLLPSNGHYLEALQLESKVTINVSGMIARTRVRQKFRNSSSLWAEGLYVFPLPENAAVDHMKLLINGMVIEGQIQEKSQARKTYTKALKSGRRAALVEQQRPNIFTTKLANIAPGSEMTVEIEYQQTLAYRDGQYQLRFPLVVGERYITPSKEGAKDPQYDLGVYSETSATSTTINQTSITIIIDSGIALSNIESPSHPISIYPQSETRTIISLRDNRVPADRDFLLQWQPELAATPKAAVFNQKRDGYEYSLFTIYPPKAELYNRFDIPRDIIFILDVSGSMSGTSIRQAKAALKLALERLKVSDKFNIIWFNNSAHKTFYDSQQATEQRIRAATEFVDTLTAGGGTEMLPALKLALSSQPDPEYLRQVVFLTDGNVSNERDLFAYIKAHLGESRLFTVGIGSAPNSFFMKRSAKAGRGTYTFIGNTNEITSKTDLLFRKLETPALTDIRLKLAGDDVEYFHDPIPDLYVGEPVTIALRGRNLSKSIVLTGKIGTNVWQYSVKLNRGYENNGVSTAWAREKIAALSETYHATRDIEHKESLKNQIIGVSTTHHLVSQHTSLVAVDVTPVNQSGMLYQERLKNNLPYGWSGKKRGQLMVAQIHLPQTATAAPRHLLLALLFMAMASLLTLIRVRQ